MASYKRHTLGTAILVLRPSQYTNVRTRKEREAVTMQNFTDAKLEIFVPQAYALKIRGAPAEIGIGVIGNYDNCVAIYPVQGYFRPLPGANPFDGEFGEISETAEHKIEVNCKRKLVNEVSPRSYEGPVINIVPLAIHLSNEKK